MRIAALTLLLLVGLVAIPVARAATPLPLVPSVELPPTYRPVAPGVLARVQRAGIAADEHWASEGHAAKCAAQIVVVDDLGSTDLGGQAGAAAEVFGCRVWLEPRVLEWAVLAGWSRVERRANLIGLCVLLAHERGHNLGLGHTDRGLMSDGHVVARPRSCVAFGRREAPPRRRAGRRGRAA